MAGGITLVGSYIRQVHGRGHQWSFHTLLVCLAACVLATQVMRCKGHCAESDRPIIMNTYRQHLDDLSAIAADILNDSTIVISPSYTDSQLEKLMGRMRHLDPAQMAILDDNVWNEYTQALNGWIWMCRAPQTLGKRNVIKPLYKDSE